MPDAQHKTAAQLTAQDLKNMPQTGPKSWATKILMRQYAGEKISPAVLSMAMRCVGLSDGT